MLPENEELNKLKESIRIISKKAQIDFLCDDIKLEKLLIYDGMYFNLKNYNIPKVTNKHIHVMGQNIPIANKYDDIELEFYDEAIVMYFAELIQDNLRKNTGNYSVNLVVKDFIHKFELICFNAMICKMEKTQNTEGDISYKTWFKIDYFNFNTL
jgi:hypothetical protein